MQPACASLPPGAIMALSMQLHAGKQRCRCTNMVISWQIGPDCLFQASVLGCAVTVATSAHPAHEAGAGRSCQRPSQRQRGGCPSKWCLHFAIYYLCNPAAALSVLLQMCPKISADVSAHRTRQPLRAPKIFRAGPGRPAVSIDPPADWATPTSSAEFNHA